MNTYAITYLTRGGQYNTVKRTGNTPETALQSFWFWDFSLEGSALSAASGERPVVVLESSVM